MNDDPRPLLSAWPMLAPGAGGRVRCFELGEVRLAVLSLLREEPTHGYQLMKQLAARLGKLYRASSGTVYPALRQLEKERLIEHQMEAGRKIYRVTRAGQKLLAAEAATVSGIWSRASEIEDLGEQLGPHSMTVAGPLAELHSVALRAAVWSGGDPDREDQVRGILRRASADLKNLQEGDRKV